MIEVGQLIGNYKVVRRIGAGGMGEVYEAVHQQIRSRAAIKVLLATHSQNPEMLNRFFHEALAVNIVGHPGLVRIFECGHLPDGAAYIVMEFLEGESLRARMRRVGGRLDGSSLLIARQIANALSATHAKKIIHRDLKPDNVMIVPDSDMPTGERIKILDFGIAKLAADTAGDSADGNLVDDGGVVRTRTGLILGTPAYMAPEQCRGLGQVDEKADVYSLGIILFEMLSGRTPFKSPGFGEMAAMHMFMPPPDLQELVPGIRPDVAQLVARLLAKKAVERPAMSDVAAELDRLFADRRRESHPSLLAIPAVTSSAAGPVRTPTPSKPHSVVSVNPRGGASLLDREPVLSVTASGDFALNATEGEPVHSTLRDATGQSGQSGQRLVVKVPRRAVVPVAIAAGAVLLVGIVLVVRLVSSGGGKSASDPGRFSTQTPVGGNPPKAPDGNAPPTPVVVSGAGALGGQAATAADAAGDKDSGGARVLSARGSQLLRSARDRLQAGDADGALAALKKTQDTDASHPDVLTAYADAAVAKKDHAAVVKHLRALQKIRRLPTPQVVQLAGAQLALAHYQDALETCAKGLKRAPESAELIRLQAQISSKLSATPRKNTGYERIED
jgi:serine/threonine protein kinase